MFSEYEKEELKPDVLCNREIKFDVFEKIVSLGADYGYRSLLQEKKLSGVLSISTTAGADNNKDQSYSVTRTNC
jgi:tRNA-specific 2-thiouridylase